jgi:L-2-hydroxyglutarate oxidase LhgO
MAEHVDCAVIGAGVVGLAIARALALPGRYFAAPGGA